MRNLNTTESLSDNVIVEYKDVELQIHRNVILSNINLSITKGSFVYLIGTVGSGKSTFLKSIYHEIPIYQGKARVFEFELENLKRKQVPYLRRRLGIVFQDFQLLIDRSVDQNLAFVLRATGWKNKKQIGLRISDVLRQVGMENKGYKLPHELSGGEQQRIAIARALLNSPELILADEPTGNLDPQTGNLILELLHDIAKSGTSVLMSTHNYTLVQKYPGRIFKCDNGIMKEVVLVHK